MSNHFTVVGTIATKPHVIGAGTPTALCTFRLACNERRYNRENGEWTDGPTNWFTINAFRGLGTHAMRSLHVGERIVVAGRLRVRQWEKDEKSGTAVEIDADALGHDLRWGVSRFEKTVGAGSDQTAPATGELPANTAPSSTDQGVNDPEPYPEPEPTGFTHPHIGTGGFASLPATG